mgnify:CR=1 FL=1
MSERIDAVAERRRQLGARDGQPRRRRIEASDCSAAALATDAICCSTRPSCASMRCRGGDALAPLRQQRARRAALGRLRRGTLPLRAGTPGAPMPARRRSSPIRLLELRRLAFEPEQARRDRADLLERERKRERLGRARCADGAARCGTRRASSRARRPGRASASAATPAKAISGRTDKVLTRDRLCRAGG